MIEENELSFQEMKLVHQDLLQNRIENVRPLLETELESYNIVKDKRTGEHYIHYVYMHIDVKASGEKELFHQFLPIENDDVLGILFNDQPYEYPTHWKHSFLRGGPEEGYVWFDPSINSDYDEMEVIAQQLAERIRAFKQQGNFDKDSVQKLLDDVDRLK